MKIRTFVRAVSVVFALLVSAAPGFAMPSSVMSARRHVSSFG